MQKGFTLVELAIVIVIIGLLVAGVLQGQELIKASERNSIATEASSYQAAITVFKSQYNALPGDFNKASTFWPTCNATLAYCDGNMDGDIQDAAPFEDTKMWQHLSLADLIKGTYTGVGNDGVPNDKRALGLNIPVSRASGVGYMVDKIGGGVYAFTNFHLMWIGTMSTSGSGTSIRPTTGLMSPADAYSFELKFDDGVATNGTYLVRNGVTSSYATIDKTDPAACVNGNTTDLVANFNMSVQDKNCLLAFRLGV